MTSQPVHGDDVLPPEIVAQAEAAIIANADDDISAVRWRQSRAHVDPPNDRAKVSSLTPGTETSSSLHSKGHVQNSDSGVSSYGAHPDMLKISQDGFDTHAKVTDDGRVNINIKPKNRRLSDLLVPALRSQLSLLAVEGQEPPPPGYIPPSLGGEPGQSPPPPLNVVIHVVGSRGDVQPFVALGKTLKNTYGHRVRLATHPTFQSFVEENDLEFFSIGGDPAELMAFMVKNPGLMPGFESIKSGDVGKRRKGMEEIVLGCWRSCIEAGDGLGAPVQLGSSSSRSSLDEGINMDPNPSSRPFIADAIIANPPSFAHVHIAERLGVPLHLMFTMPWSPTQSFPHPLANIQSSNADVNITNFMSYALVEMMTWQGLGDIINRFREHTLGLEPISLIWAPGILSRLRVPYTYCWSPALIPKPRDWGSHIDISGFFFLSLASSYTPAPDLAQFLAHGPPPVYIGFGSIVVDDPSSLTKIIFEAVRKTGVRALVSKGWGGLGADALEVPNEVFMLGNVPHDWLFKHVSCVVHHGGAGTTAAGISLGRPTVVVPFFGDQPFWGAMVARAGAGPTPVPFKQLTVDNLAAAILDALKPETLAKAQSLGVKVRDEQGSEMGGKSFHDHLDVDNLRCSLAPSRAAVWRVKRTKTRLSALAATVLANEGLLDFADLKLYRHREYDSETGPLDPISGGASALLGTIASLSMGVADFPVEIFKAFRSKTSTKSNDGTIDSTTPTPLSGSRSPSQLNLSRESDELTRELSSSTASTTVSRLTSSGGSEPKTSMTSFESPSVSGNAAPRRGDALRQALHGALASSWSSSRERRHESRASSPAGTRSDGDSTGLSLESAVGARKGIGRIVEAGLRSPMDFTVGIARGFHNAPKLYGDDTVRPQHKVTDLQSGLKAAGKEFGYGFYDGISGLITHPMKGAEKEGAAGFVKGLGKGIGGLVLKPGAAIWGLPGYTFMGLHKEMCQVYGSSVLNYVISARVAQGYEHWKGSTKEERVDIINKWKENKSELQSERQRVHEEGPEGQETGHLSTKGLLQTRHLTFDERKRLHEERKAKRGQERSKLYGENGSRCPFCTRMSLHRHTSQAVDSSKITPENSGTGYEEEIRQSIAMTSRGDPEEDLVIERAMRASLREMDASGGSEDEALARAIQASVSEASAGLDEVPDPLFTAALEHAIQQSLDNSSALSPFEFANPLWQAVSEHGSHDDDLILAKEASVASRDLRSLMAREEEEIVLEYVKKQSLQEDQYKKLSDTRRKSAESADTDDEDLKRAIKHSLGDEE